MLPMKKFFIIAGLTFIFSSANAEKNLTASTPAGIVVRKFLGISLTDSIDFIRWQIMLNNDSYSLNCNYGLSRPNTNGFINGGKNVNLQGKLQTTNGYIQLYNDDKKIKALIINEDLFQLTDEKNALLIGNAGWSYTLNSIEHSPAQTLVIKSEPEKTILADSMWFEGRTPCGIPNAPVSSQCYKLKWRLILYTDQGNPGSYKIIGTAWRKKEAQPGKWKIENNGNGQVFYKLFDANGNLFFSLFKADNNILFFVDEKENPLTGNEDFSYTLNRVK